ncbi:hypothetical protein RIF29_31179 [Crotalaria pallida]|uniref:Uncharacterized protein n=1 Tax=Crotalaria pallida TaxID=3830 RepID=A0AAN9EH93_CROPI
MLLVAVEDPIEKMKLIDTIQRLGVSYHFENEIEAILRDIHKSKTPFNNSNYENGDLHKIALWFRLLRQQGYDVSCDVFEKFRDDKGNFKKSILIDDVLGMLSLYEAAHLAIHGEDILDQALAFTTFHLQSELSGMSPDHKERVDHALKWPPLRKCMQRLTARFNISIYSRDESRNQLLLEFAVLDFNTLQAQYREELRYLTEWWKKLELATKLPYARDRIVENYCFILCAHFKPQYTIGRTIGSKFATFVAGLDDTFDAYATVDELELMTEAILRWDTSPMDSLPETMKVVVKSFIELLAEMELMTAEDGKSSLVQYVKQALQSLAKSYMNEAKWRNEGYVPTYDEYKDNGVVSSAFPLVLTFNLLCLGEYANKEVFDWVSNDGIPKMVKASSIMARLLNDMSSYKFEQKRGAVVSAVECYIKQYGTSEEEAITLILKDIENYWKDINEECLIPNVVPKPVIEIILNYTRMFEFMYADMVDRYTDVEPLKDYVTLLFVDAIRIGQQK